MRTTITEASRKPQEGNEAATQGLNSSVRLSEIGVDEVRTEAVAMAEPEKQSMDWTTTEGTPFPWAPPG